MGQLSKATIAQYNNHRKSQNPTVEDTSDDEDMYFKENNLLEEGFFFLDNGDAIVEDSDHSDSNDDKLSEDELDELQNEAEIKHFNAVLFEAQVMAVKAEHEPTGQKTKQK